MIRTIILLTLFVTGVSSVTECQKCTAAVDLLHLSWGDKADDECFVDLALYICETFKIESNYICDLIINGFTDEFVWVTGQVIATPHQICGLLMHNDCGTFHNPFDDTWNLTIPAGKPEFVPQKAVVNPAKTSRVLHLTDLHVDMHYVPGSEAGCGSPQCCRPQDADEVTSEVKSPAGYWGNIGPCDSPYHLLINMLEDVSERHSDIDYVMISGDLVSHAVWAYNNVTHAAVISNLSDTIRSYFPEKKVYFAVGNHEGVPIDNFAPHFTPRQFHMDWLYGTMDVAWKGWVPTDQEKTLKYNGCFVTKIGDGLRLISLNNAYGDRINFWLYVNQTDPDGTLTWLANQLLDAEKAGDKVHILAHIPGANGEALEGYSLNYYRLVNRFANTITAQFFGHTHTESFQISYEDPDDYRTTPTSVVYVAPSLTPYSRCYPAYRIYTVDGDYEGSTHQVIDFEEWFFNLTENNANPTAPRWEQLYKSVNLEYGLASNTPSEWNNMIERMKTDNDLWTRYIQNRYRRGQYDGVVPCLDDKCKFGFLCDARQLHNSPGLCSDLQGYTAIETSPRAEFDRMPSKVRTKKLRERRDQAKCPL